MTLAYLSDDYDGVLAHFLGNVSASIDFCVKGTRVENEEGKRFIFYLILKLN